MMRQITFVLLVFLFFGNAVADEIRPGYLQLKETSDDMFSVTWKVPAKGDKKLSLNVQMPANCSDQTERNSRWVNGAYIQHWIINCEAGLVEKVIAITGLNMSSTDVLLHLEFNDGSSQSAHLTPTSDSYRVPVRSSTLQISATYTGLGIEHILRGIDHLLFVFALLLIVRGWRRLVATITAFTIAHSITLAAATLGLVRVPQQPVEAIIALSILFLAVEIVRGKQGHSGYAVSYPWLIAFIFGLLHGFGFAGALAEIGLPQQAIPLALIFFNVGVELGQLLFIAAVLSVIWVLQQLKQPVLLTKAELVTTYAIGGVASFWLFERISAF